MAFSFGFVHLKINTTLPYVSGQNTVVSHFPFNVLGSIHLGSDYLPLDIKTQVLEKTSLLVYQFILVFLLQDTTNKIAKETEKFLSSCQAWRPCRHIRDSSRNTTCQHSMATAPIFSPAYSHTPLSQGVSTAAEIKPPTTAYHIIPCSEEFPKDWST